MIKEEQFPLSSEQIVEEFEGLTDWEDIYAHIIYLGKSAPSLPEEVKIDDNRVAGCTSQVWLIAEMENGVVKFHADSDAMIVRGLIALLVMFYSHRTPTDILSLEPTFFQDIGLTTHLSQNRSNGLVAMAKKIKMYALGFTMISDNN